MTKQWHKIQSDTVTIELLLNCFELACKKMYPCVFLLDAVFLTQSEPQGEVKMHQAHLHGVSW